MMNIIRKLVALLEGSVSSLNFQNKFQVGLFIYLFIFIYRTYYLRHEEMFLFYGWEVFTANQIHIQCTDLTSVTTVGLKCLLLSLST